MGWHELEKPDRSRWVGNMYSMEWMNAYLSFVFGSYFLESRPGLSADTIEEISMTKMPMPSLKHIHIQDCFPYMFHPKSLNQLL